VNEQDRERWRSQVLDEIFVALAASEQLDEALVYKGARVLNLRLGIGRQSLDLDSNLTTAFVQKNQDREAQRLFLEQEITRAVRRHFERQKLVRFELGSLNVETYPPKSHPMGWDAFKVKMRLNDLTGQVKGAWKTSMFSSPEDELVHSRACVVKVFLSLSSTLHVPTRVTRNALDLGHVAPRLLDQGASGARWSGENRMEHKSSAVVMTMVYPSEELSAESLSDLGFQLVPFCRIGGAGDAKCVAE
jgi:hypothetical protein